MTIYVHVVVYSFEFTHYNRYKLMPEQNNIYIYLSIPFGFLYALRICVYGLYSVHVIQ